MRFQVWEGSMPTTSGKAQREILPRLNTAGDRDDAFKKTPKCPKCTLPGVLLLAETKSIEKDYGCRRRSTSVVEVFAC
jgi:hypothetical protein